MRSRSSLVVSRWWPAVLLVLAVCVASEAATPGTYAGVWTGWIDVHGNGHLVQRGAASGSVEMTLTQTRDAISGTLTGPGFRANVQAVARGASAYGSADAVLGQGAANFVFEATVEDDRMRATLEFSRMTLRRTSAER